MANGIMFSGAGVGMVAMPLAYSAGVEYLGLNGALLVNGVTSLLVVVLILTFYPTKRYIIDR